MTKSFKSLFFMLLLNAISMHGMEDANKDPRLLLELPADIFGTIIKYSHVNDLFNNIRLLIRCSLICKKFEHLRTPDTIKTTLNLDQKTLDNHFEEYAFFKFHQEFDGDYTSFLKLLIAMNAHTNSLCKNLNSCVQLATNAYIVDYFITHHDDNINQVDKLGNTPLRWAIDFNKPNIVRVLLKHNADMYLADKKGITPTDMALLCDHVECLKALIEHGVDTTIEYSRGEGYKLTIAECAKLRTNRSHEEKAHMYNEIYKLVTGEEIPKSWYEKSVSELLNDTCVIS